MKGIGLYWKMIVEGESYSILKRKLLGLVSRVGGYRDSFLDFFCC